MRLPAVLVCFLLAQVAVSQQIHPGTWSNRTGEGGTVSDPPTAGVSDYFDMTPWESSPYQQFRLHRGTDAPNGENFWLNFRMMFPQPYDENPGEKYPMIVMLHGLGEAGVRGSARFPAYDASDPRYLNNDHNLYHGGYPHLSAVERGIFPGFVVVPQNTSTWSEGQLDGVISMIEELLENYPIDPYRIYLHGYSNGADGVWRIAEKRPDLFAAMLPMSWINLSVDRSRFIHLPIWYFQGELDGNPLATTARYMMTLLEQEGATPRYTEYLNGGHAIWDRAYAEPDFFSWMLGYEKTDIMAYYGRTAVCPNEDVNIRLGVSPGFNSYQWRVTTDGGVQTFDRGGQDNFELVATQTGDYQVRVSRNPDPGSADWSPWSDPLTITVQDDIPTPQITIDGSPHLPSPDGRTSAQLSVPDEFEFYQWYRNASPVNGATGNSVSVSQTGNYFVNVSLAESCPDISSDTIRITNNIPPEVLPPGNLQAEPVSEVAIGLSWEDASQNETNFEVYRARSQNGPFDLVKNLPGNTTQVKDSALVPSTKYFYRVRAVNDQSPSPLSNIASATTLADTIAPSAPGFLSHELTDTRRIVLYWTPATDNSDLIIYDIIVNGKVVGTTTSLSFTLGNLNEESIYTIYVRARDRAGNRSPLSNQVTVITIFEGVAYRYYYGGLWAETADYAGWPVEKQGYIDNVDISREENGGVRPDPQVNYFAFDFDGYLYIEKGGNYVFSLEAAAGSVLQVGAFTLDNDGQHSVRTEIGKTKLSKGPVRFKVKYYDRTEEEVLTIKYSGPDTNNELIEIPAEALTSSKKTFPSVPESPANFSAREILEREIDLTWDDESDNETGFEVFKAEPLAPYRMIRKTSANQTSLKANELAPLRTYNFLVRAVGKTGTSDFDSLTATTGLPLSQFTVDCQSSGNVINWQSGLPWTGEPFIVERSANQDSSVVIGRIGSDSVGMSFDWLDNTYAGDTTYYRIGQRSPQGGVGYSQWVASTCTPVDFRLYADLYPVPVTNGYLTIRMRTMKSDIPVEIVVLDNIGRIHLETTVPPDPLRNPYILDLSRIATKGLFIISLRQGGESYQQKIIIDQ